MTQDYQVKTLLSMSEVDSMRPVWEAMQWHPGADFEFFKLIIQSRSNIISPCVLVGYLNDEPIALWAGRIETATMPVRLGYATLARIPIRQAVLMAGGLMGQQVESFAPRFMTSMNSLLRKHGLDRAILEQVKLASPLDETAGRVFRRVQLSSDRDGSQHWLLELPKRWDDFLKLRSKKHRYWLKRLPSVLDRDFAGKWSIKRYSTADDARDFVDAAEEVATKTYHRGLGVGFRRDDETIRRIYMEARRGQLRSYVLFIGDVPKAFWYCFIYGRTLYLAATGYDAAYRTYELGTVLLMKVFQDHCGKEIDVVDFGLGDAGYKQRFASDSFMETSLCVFSDTPRGLGLNLVHRSTLATNRFFKAVLDRLQLTQRVKTLWRRATKRPTSKSGSVDANSAPEPAARAAS